MRTDLDNTEIFFGASPEIFARARQLRRNMTKSEKTLWAYLRNQQLCGFYFRRQHPMGQFIADFFCAKARLVIELDGGIHDVKEVREHDISRQQEIENWGITVIRFRNEEVMDNIQDVLLKISRHLQTFSSNINK